MGSCMTAHWAQLAWKCPCLVCSCLLPITGLVVQHGGDSEGQGIYSLYQTFCTCHLTATTNPGRLLFLSLSSMAYAHHSSSGHRIKINTTWGKVSWLSTVGPSGESPSNTGQGSLPILPIPSMGVWCCPRTGFQLYNHLKRRSIFLSLSRQVRLQSQEGVFLAKTGNQYFLSHQQMAVTFEVRCTPVQVQYMWLTC